MQKEKREKATITKHRKKKKKTRKQVSEWLK